jgi:hypothetical protein
MTRTEFSEEVFGPIYTGTPNQPISPTQLALLFIVLGMLRFQLTRNCH